VQWCGELKSTCPWQDLWTWNKELARLGKEEANIDGCCSECRRSWRMSQFLAKAPPRSWRRKGEKEAGSWRGPRMLLQRRIAALKS